ncbi:MAG: hypothetical protein RR280_04420 [Bacteroidaceae bacterium]
MTTDTVASTKPTQPAKPTSDIQILKVKKSPETNMVQKMSSFKALGIDAARTVREGMDPKLLLNLVITNNTLPLCIEAMEVNVDGTGHDIVAVDENTPISEPERLIAESFFKEPFPAVSMIKLRREVRRYLEGTGNAYIELLPSANGELVMMRSLNPLNVRLGALSESVTITREIERNGSLIEVSMRDRERSYIYQEEGRDPTYLIEFGATQDIHAQTGVFSGKSEEGTTRTLSQVEKGNQLIHLKMNDDPNSDYGIPRWISQSPSVVGSRKAEEQNLEFFDAGGIPNVIVFVKGGEIAKTTTDQLNGFLSGQIKTGGRAAVVEVASTTGTLDKAGNVDVQVERFGSETMGDKMYENYDQRCEDRVRLSFRLPALFIGKTSDYNYATAKVAYQVAEAQVFKPDRDEFDAIMNQIIRKELKLTTVMFKSRPITLNDMDAQLKALELTKQVIDPKGLVTEVSRIANVELTYVDGKEFTQFKNMDGSVSNPQQPVQSVAPVAPAKEKAPKPDKKLTATESNELAKKLARTSGLLDDGTDLDEEEGNNLKKIFASLDDEDQTAVATVVSVLIFGQDGMVDKGIFN